MGCIYMFTNQITNKGYIGKCHGDVKKRYNAHIRGDGSQPLKKAIDEYGIENFTFEILHDGILDIFLADYEEAAIAKYNTFKKGYNETPNGGGGAYGENHPQYGKPRDEKVKRKLSESAKASPLVAEAQRKATEAASIKNKGTPRSEETKQKISKSHIGITHSEETKQIMSEQRKGRPSPNKGKPSPLRGVPRSEETKAKLSQKLKGRQFTAEHRANISTAQTGERNNNFGKPRSVETCQKIGEANASPYKSDAYMLFSALPESMPLREKRKVLCEKFADVPYGTIHGWTRQWQPEGISKLQDSREVFARNKAIAYDIFKSSYPTMTLREIHKILRERFSDYHKSTIYKWTKQWQSEQTS